MRIGYLMQAGVPDVRAQHPSGAAVHVICTIRELARLGHDVHLIASLDGVIWRSEDLSHFTPVCTPVMDRLPARFLESVVRRIQSELSLPYISLFDSLRFSEACCRELAGFDVLYERMGWMGRGGSIAARKMAIPHVLEVNGDHIFENESQGLRCGAVQGKSSIFLMRRVAKAATHVVATGEGWRRRFVKQWDVDPGRVSVVQNGSEVVDLLRRKDLRCFTNRTEDTDEPLRVVYAGSFDPWQNIPLLLRAVGECLSSGTKVELTLAGDGPMRKLLEAQSRELRISSRVTFTGHLSLTQLARLLAASDVGISLYSGREEFTGLKILDYKSAGLATIATGRDGEPSSLQGGVTGVIIPPDQQSALTSAIRTLAANRDRLSGMGRHARLDAETRHGWRHTAQALHKLLTGIARDWPWTMRSNAQMVESASHQ